MDKIVGIIFLCAIVAIIKGIAYIGVANFVGLVVLIGGTTGALIYLYKRERERALAQQKAQEEAKQAASQRQTQILLDLILPFLSAACTTFARYAPSVNFPATWEKTYRPLFDAIHAALLPSIAPETYESHGKGHPIGLLAAFINGYGNFGEPYIFTNPETLGIVAPHVIEAMLKTPSAARAKKTLDNRHLNDWLARHDWNAEFQAIAQELEQAVPQEVITSGGLLLGKPSSDVQNLSYTIPPLFPLALTHTHRFRHTYIIGKTGSGKSTLLKTLIAQDLGRPVGLIVISPENGLFDDLAALIPPQRFNDVLYFDPTDTSPPVIGFNPFTFEQGEDLTQKAEETYTIFSAALGDLGVKMQPLLQNAVYALLQQPGATLKDLDRLLYPQDSSFRRELLRVPHLDERTRKFWQDYDKSAYYKSAYEPVVNRLDPFFRPPLVDILSTPSFSFPRVINERPTIFFCNLSKLRGVQAQIVGQLLLAQIQQTLLQRDQTPEHARIPSFLFIDEFQTYAATSEGALVELFNRARKYKMGVTLAHQVTADIPSKLLSVITGNVGTLITMQVSAEDAPFFAKELQLKTITPNTDQEPRLRPDLLQNLRVGQAFVRTPDLKAGVPLVIQLTSPPEGRDTSAYIANLKKTSKLNFGKQPSTEGNGRQEPPHAPAEAFTSPPPSEDAQASTNARRKARARKATTPPPPPPPDEEENYKM